MKSLTKILGLCKNYKGPVALNIVFNVLSILFSVFSLSMLIPFLDLLFLKDTADYVQYTTSVPEFALSVEYLSSRFYYEFASLILSDPENGKSSALIFICIMVVSMVFFKNVFRYLAMYFIAIVRNGIMRDLRNKLYKKTLSLPLSFFSEERKGDIIARMTNDVQEIEWTALTSIEMLFKDPVALIVFLATLLIISPTLTLFVLILLPLTGIVIGRVGKSLKATSLLGQQKMGELVSRIEETLGGLRVIKAFNSSEQFVHGFTRMNEVYRRLMVRMYRKRDLASPMSEFLGVLVLVIVIWFGGNLVLEESAISASVFIAYIAIFSQLIPPAKAVTTAYFNLQKGAASADRVDDIMKAEEIIVEINSPVAIKSFESNITFRNVGFSYGNTTVLKNINLEVTKGKTIAIVGPSGGGKSTLVNLLPRFYDVSEGCVYIDETDSKRLVIKDLRSLFGLVTQQSILFNDSVYNNIAFGRTNLTTNDIERAAKVANAWEFIEKLPRKFQTNIGDGGNKLSGGQKQRLSLARAIVGEPPILILDEATSSLDTESEKLVQDALEAVMKDRTVIVIAHRLSTVQNADEIIVIENGTISERGNHKELIAQNGVYKKLIDLQTLN